MPPILLLVAAGAGLFLARRWYTNEQQRVAAELRDAEEALRAARARDVDPARARPGDRRLPADGTGVARYATLNAPAIVIRAKLWRSMLSHRGSGRHPRLAKTDPWPIPPNAVRRRSFQDLILRLERFWADQGCVILQPYDMEMGAGTFHPATDASLAWPEALARRLRAALAPPQGRPLWREPEPAPALLPVPGDPEAVAARHPGPLSPEPLRHRHRPLNTTSASSRTTGRARRSAPGGSAGRCGSTAWR